MKNMIVVGAVIINETNEVLCAQRSMYKDMPYLWEFPGGKVEQNESYEEALVREIQEELGCTIQVLNKVESTIIESEDRTLHLITYQARIIKGEPMRTEHEQLVWLPVSKLSSLEWTPADIPTVQRLMGNIC